MGYTLTYIKPDKSTCLVFNGLGKNEWNWCIVLLQYTNSIHFRFTLSSKHRLIGRKSSAQHDNGQRSTLDHHQTALGLHIVLRVQPTFRYGKKCL